LNSRDVNRVPGTRVPKIYLILGSSLPEIIPNVSQTDNGHSPLISASSVHVICGFY